MNKRIKELYGNALDKAVPYTWHNLDHAEVEKIMKEFAELIVEECMKLNSKELSITAIERLLPLYAEHFGVEL